MVCFQCQETARNTSCTVRGVGGKPEETANLQNLLIHVRKGIAIYNEHRKNYGGLDKTTGPLAAQGLFSTPPSSLSFPV